MDDLDKSWWDLDGVKHDSPHDSPCESYAGNVCSGFGAKTICMFCGWDMIDHQDFLLGKR